MNLRIKPIVVQIHEAYSILGQFWLQLFKICECWVKRQAGLQILKYLGIKWAPDSFLTSCWPLFPAEQPPHSQSLPYTLEVVTQVMEGRPKRVNQIGYQGGTLVTRLRFIEIYSSMGGIGGCWVTFIPHCPSDY